MERLGSAKWLEIFERFRDLKKVEKHCSISIEYANMQQLSVWRNNCWSEILDSLKTTNTSSSLFGPADQKIVFEYVHNTLKWQKSVFFDSQKEKKDKNTLFFFKYSLLYLKICQHIWKIPRNTGWEAVAQWFPNFSCARTT